MPSHEPKYYLRMKLKDGWYFLWRMQRNNNPPVWLEEATSGAQVPRLYKTLVFARNSLDRFVSTNAEQSEVAIWKGDDG